MRHRAILLVGFALGLGGQGCQKSPEPSHYLRVDVQTDLAAPDDIDRLQIVVERQGVPFFSQTYDQEVIRALRDHGESLYLDNPHPSGDSPDKQLLTVKPIQISVLGYQGDQVRIVRSARLQFNDGHRHLSLPLCRTCLDLISCQDGQTCRRGQCQDEDVSAKELPVDEGGPGTGLAECGGP